jgi:hypothetical protein
MKDSSVHDDLRQLSHGSTTARSYGCYDINGFRFRSTKFEIKNPHAATTNSGVVTTASASDGSITEYFGVIQNIVELKFEGSKDLRVVLFYYDWFNSKLGSGVKHNKKLGLVEVNHKLRLSGYNPFFLAHQVEMVDYMSYPCHSESLEPWWIVQRVCPPVDCLFLEMKVTMNVSLIVLFLKYFRKMSVMETLKLILGWHLTD